MKQPEVEPPTGDQQGIEGNARNKSCEQLPEKSQDKGKRKDRKNAQDKAGRSDNGQDASPDNIQDNVHDEAYHKAYGEARECAQDQTEVGIKRMSTSNYRKL